MKNTARIAAFAGFMALTSLSRAFADDGAAAATNSTPVVAEEEKDGWSFTAYAYTYLQENDRDYLQPTFTADRGWLHLEARYNYEDYETASFWVGYNLSFGKDIAVTLTPMVGGALGETKGFAPGFRLNAEWWKLTLYSEGEFFFDAGSSNDDFFYNWSELSLDMTHGFRVGLVAQKETSEDVRRGFLAGFKWDQKGLGEVDLTAYLFDLDQDEQMYVFAVGLSF